MKKADLKEVYRILYDRYGPQGWWPADTQLEVIVGAIITQNTAWKNVEKAIANLRSSGALASPAAMKGIGRRRIAILIRPAGYYNIKAGRLMNFLRFLERGHGSSLRALSKLGTGSLRRELLGVNGVGPETCDSILLYAMRRPVFVVDAYTKRVFSRHGLFAADAHYEDVQKVFTDNLSNDVKMFNEYHALIVRLGKEACRTEPECSKCPLKGLKIACK